MKICLENLCKINIICVSMAVKRYAIFNYIHAVREIKEELVWKAVVELSESPSISLVCSSAAILLNRIKLVHMQYIVQLHFHASGVFSVSLPLLTLRNYFTIYAEQQDLVLSPSKHYTYLQVPVSVILCCSHNRLSEMVLFNNETN